MSVNPQQKVNVMHIRDSLGIHGAERVMLTLANNLNKDYYAISFLCLRRSDGRTEPLINQLKKQNITYHTINVDSKFDFGSIFKMRKIFKENKIQIFHTHDYKSDLYAFLASIGLRIKRVATAHGSTRDSLIKKIYLFIDEKITYKFFDKIISVSKDLKSFLINRGVKPSKIEVIQNGFDVNVLLANTGSDEKSLVIPQNKKVFGVIGRLFPDKGHQYFIDAFADLYKTHQDIIGLIVGDGPFFESIENKIKQVGHENNIQMCGTRSNMKEIYDSIDFLVIPSLTEGLPYVLLESMALGIPVLATSVGDIPLLIQDKKTGYLIEPANKEQLESGMRYLMDNIEKVKNQAKDAVKFIEDHFSASKMAKETESLYKGLIE